ncbi:MAG: phosphate starvation protein PhoH, partial [Proteobacteria bacterium]|nr:phosphate starvation protein PhoH [Pseudomonadota bacterium]
MTHHPDSLSLAESSLPPTPDRRLFVLDTNVLMHDPTALFRFQEHDIHLPMMVLEELDRAKKGVSEVARNVRQVSRFLDDVIADASKEEIDRGLPLPGPLVPHGEPASGRLFFQIRPNRIAPPASLPGNAPDNDILSMALTLQ